MRFDSAEIVLLCYKLVVFTLQHSLLSLSFVLLFSVCWYLLVYTFSYLSFSVLSASSRQGERILLFYRSIYLVSVLI